MSGASERHSQRAATALQALAEVDPAIGALSLWCEHRDGEATRTTGDRITYGAEFEALAAHEQRGIAAHHILHVALRHSARLADLQTRLGEGFDADRFNLAADALVNEALLLGDHALPRPAVTVTELLAAVGTTVGAEEAVAEWDVERLYFALSQTGDGQDNARGYAEAQEFEPDVDPNDGGGPSDDATDMARWRQHLTRAMDAGRQAGRGIGRIGHRLADVPAPRIPWEVHLRRLLTQAVTVQPQPNPRRPARRWIAGVAEAERAGSRVPGFQPGQRPFSEVPRIAVGLDASSSIDDARLALFWAEVTGIARRMAAELHLMVFDDAIRHQVRLDPAQTRFELPDLPRGGGTAFVPVVQEAQRLGVAALVMLTDLEGEAGLPPRGLQVFWVVPEPGGTEPPYGKLIDMTG